MKLLLVGVFSNKWSTNIEMADAFRCAGHHVFTFDYRDIASKKSNINPIGRLAGLLTKLTNFFRVYDIPFVNKLHYLILGRRYMNAQLLDAALIGNYDLIILSKCDTVSPHVIKKISSITKTWYFFMDSLAHGKKINVIKYVQASDFISATFSDVVEYFKKNSEKKHIYLQNQGVDLGKFRFLGLIDKPFDVIFVGVKNSYRSAIVKKLREANIKVDCYGDGWENLPIYNEELVYLYNRAKIILNFCRAGNGFSVRVFQAMACSAFVLSDYCADFHYHFTKGCHIDWVEDDWVGKVNYYLDRPDIINKISSEAHDLVGRKYSWECVIDNMFGNLTHD